jgi:hypothetical protein
MIHITEEKLRAILKPLNCQEAVDLVIAVIKAESELEDCISHDKV